MRGHWLHFDLDSGMLRSSKSGDELPAPETELRQERAGIAHTVR